MHADDAGIREHFLGNGLYELSLRRLAEERICGADCKLHAGEHDEQRNRRAMYPSKFTPVSMVMTAPSSTTLVAMTSLRLSLDVASTDSDLIMRPTLR